MFRLRSLALAAVAVLGLTMGVPNISRADDAAPGCPFAAPAVNSADCNVNVGLRRANFGIGFGPSVVVTPPPYVVSAPPVVNPIYNVAVPTPPVVVTPPPIVVPTYRPLFRGHVSFRHDHRDHHEHFRHHR